MTRRCRREYIDLLEDASCWLVAHIALTLVGARIAYEMFRRDKETTR